MTKPNEMTFCEDDYRDEFGDVSKNKLWRDIADFLQILMKNRYICTVRDEGEVIVINYDYDEMEICTTYPFWIEPEDYEVKFVEEPMKFGEEAIAEDEDGGTETG